MSDEKRDVENHELEDDIHISCEHSYEAEEIAANFFLTRGLCKVPSSEGEASELYHYGCCQKATYDWLNDVDVEKQKGGIVEVRFKNGRKDFFLLPNSQDLYEVGDIVLVEAASGKDIGIVSMIGDMVKLQMQNKSIKEAPKKIFSKAQASDIEKWVSIVEKENNTMMKSRYSAWDLNLNMKVNNVEYQGDGSKAIFYYSADERIDFRELIKILADKFKIRIEMRQIGVRQEAACLGGIGSCGRELCCSSWLNHFQSVSTSTAKNQQLSLNPQKLAGQCGKLKCCLNYENQTYLSEMKNFPPMSIVLHTQNGDAACHKIDIFKKLMWFYYKSDYSHTLYAIPLEKVNEIISQNKRGKKIEKLEDFAEINQKKVDDFDAALNLDDLKKIND